MIQTKFRETGDKETSYKAIIIQKGSNKGGGNGTGKNYYHSKTTQTLMIRQQHLDIL